jgi:hypothetical protein
MTAFIGVILVSSLQRLALYEAAYGFTRLRTYSHLCVLWIGVLFLGILLLEIFQKYRYFTLATVISVAGFVLTMNIINVDGFITTKNFQRLSVEDAYLDTYYLKTLSNDAIPILIDLADDPNIAEDEEEDIAAILACRAKRFEEAERKWPSFIFPYFRAKRLIQDNPELWDSVELTEEEWGGYYIEQEEGDFYCDYYGWD